VEVYLLVLTWLFDLESTSVPGLSMRMNVPAYPEERVFKEVFASLCEGARLPEPILRVRGTPSIFSGERRDELYRCDEVRHLVKR
jgi:hypothetical protein